MKEWFAKSVESSEYFRVTDERKKSKRTRVGEESNATSSVSDLSSDECVLCCGGLTDLQVNGYSGVDFSDPGLTEEQADSVCLELASLGVTHFLPTLTTHSLERLGDALGNLNRLAASSRVFGKMMLGIHLEGPFISSIDGPRGAHPLQHCKAPDVNQFQNLQELAGGRIVVVTMSPEYDESPEFIENISKDVIVSIGHTASTPEQIQVAVDSGATMSTHLGNGMHKEIPRHPNYLWEQLADDRLDIGLIGDGVHLDPSTIKVMMRAKGIERCFLVSDSTTLSGKPAGLYSDSTLGNVEVTDDHRLVIAGQRTFNAGAYRPLKDAVPFLLNNQIATKQETFQMMVQNPRRILGNTCLRDSFSQDDSCFDESNFVLFNLNDENGMEILKTVVDGESVFEAD